MTNDHDNQEGERAYKVGYGRPPVEHRFPPGRSANPKGRPRQAKTVSSVIAAALAERIPVRENGRLRRLTKLEASVKQLANNAVKGDMRAILAVIALGQAADSSGVVKKEVVPLDEADQRVLDQLIRRITPPRGKTDHDN